MIEFISNVIGADKQVDLIIAIIGFMSAAIVAIIGLFGSSLTIIMSKRNEKKVELRKIKENQYIEFLGSIAEIKIANSNEKHEINKLLSSRIQTIYLIGSNEVQKALSDFLLILIKEKVSTEEQSVLYANLIRAMKKDLYGENEISLESIPYITFDI